MTIDQCMMIIVLIGALVGGVDRILNNRFGLGNSFEGAITLMGDIAVNILGLLMLIPVLANWIKFAVTPLFGSIGIDPAAMSGIFAADAGGFDLATGIAIDPQIGLYYGGIVCTMLGAGIIGLPIAQGIIKKEDRQYFIRGLLIGMICVPFASFVGGIVAGFPISSLLLNTLPVFTISILLAFGLLKMPAAMIRLGIGFASLLRTGATIGIIIGIAQMVFHIPALTHMPSFFEAGEVILQIVLVLLGIMPLMELIKKALGKPLMHLEAYGNYNIETYFGLFTSMVNIFPALKTYNDMTPKGKTLISAWMVPMVGIFGDCIAYNASVAPEMILPMLVGKAVGGIIVMAIFRFVPQGIIMHKV